MNVDQQTKKKTTKKLKKQQQQQQHPTLSGLQNQLDSLKVCCDRLKMEVNTEKTKVMVFRKGGHLSKHEKSSFPSL